MMLGVALAVVLGLFGRTRAEDVICSVNGRRSLNTVDDMFIGLSIDPASLIAGININYTSLLLARHLAPAYVRIAGASTEYLRYSRDEEEPRSSAQPTVTSSTWRSLNEWFAMANLTPVFALNDADKVNGAWNPKASYPLLDLSDRLGVQGLWQLGFDSSCKTLLQYREDLLTLRHVIDTFPSRKKQWKIVGSDVSGYAYNTSGTRHFLQSLKGQVDRFMWENASSENDDEFPDVSVRSRLQRLDLEIWTTAPKAAHAVTFGSALRWARQIGEAARSGYSVVFRQPRLHEFFVDTPTFWVSLLHKHFMGREVLDLRFVPEEHFHAFAHCTRKQNDFPKLGAISIMAVNKRNTTISLALKVGTAYAKKINIHSYILTSEGEASVNTFLNGKQLSMQLLEDNEKLEFTPKLRRAHVTKFLSLSLPPKSIAFFVLPGARLPVCIHEEYNMKLLMREIHEDQNMKFESEEDEGDELRNSEPERTTQRQMKDFKGIFQQIEQELEDDERYYNDFSYVTEAPPKNFKRDTAGSKRKKKIKKLLSSDVDSGEIRNFVKDNIKSRSIDLWEVLNSDEINEEVNKIVRKLKNIVSKKKLGREQRDINMDLVRIKADRPTSHKFYRNQDPHEHSTLHHTNRRISDLLHRHHPTRLHVPRHPLSRFHRLKGKRESDEGVQDAVKFLAGADDDFMRRHSKEWDDPGVFSEDEDEMDVPFMLGHSMDEHEEFDEDLYEMDGYSDDPFIRRKRSDLLDEKYHFIVGRPVDPSKIVINPKQKAHQVKLLKQRLARRKKMADAQRRVHHLKALQRATRSIYVSKMKPTKKWKPSDILNFTKPKRSVDSSENEIESTLDARTTVVPGVVPISSTTQLRTTTTGTTGLDSEAEVFSNCVSNEECLSLVLGSCLEPLEGVKSGWMEKIYGKVHDFLIKMQKDILQLIVN